MAGPDEDETQPEAPGGDPARFVTGVSEAATPAPTSETVPQRVAVDTDEPTEYAAPVDPWGAAEAAAIAAGHSYAAPPLNPAGTWPIAGATEPTATEPGRGRGRALLIGGAAAAVIAGVAAAAVILWPGFPALDYHRLEEVKRITPATPFTYSFTDTEVLGDRAYFAGAGADGRLQVMAADTTPGDKTLWTKDIGSANAWTSMRVMPSAVVLYSGVDSATSTSRMVVLNPETGNLLWERQLGYYDEVLLGAKTALWSDRETKRLVGLGLTDGLEKWAEPDPDATAIHEVQTPDDLTGPAGTSGRPFAPNLEDDDRFVQLDADRTATVRDLDTGKVLQTQAAVASNSDKVVAYDDRLFVLEPGSPKRIFEYDLADLKAQPRSLHTVGSAEEIDGLTPCGGQLCFIRTAGYDRTASEIVAVGGDGDWELTVPKTETLVPVGDNGLLAVGDDGTTLIVDRKKVWTLDAGVAVRLDAGNVLRFSDSLSSSPGNRAMSGFHLGGGAGDIAEMGELRDVRSESCAWNTSVIACAGKTEFVVYSFAG